MLPLPPRRRTWPRLEFTADWRTRIDSSRVIGRASRRPNVVRKRTWNVAGTLRDLIRRLLDGNGQTFAEELDFKMRPASENLSQAKRYLLRYVDHPVL